MDRIQRENAVLYAEQGFRGTTIARLLNMDRSALRYALGGFRQRSTIGDDDLDIVVSAIAHQNPHAGHRFIQMRLRIRGISVSRQRVRNSIWRVDAGGVDLRRRRVLRRRVYHSPHFNFVWHVDGYHKLIRYMIM
jgi:hypothetical protein